MPSDKEAQDFEKWGQTPPSSDPHGTDGEIRENLRPLKVTRWRQEGNKLIGTTDWGEVVNHLPTNVLLVGVDEKGHPKFDKIATK